MSIASAMMMKWTTRSEATSTAKTSVADITISSMMATVAAEWEERSESLRAAVMRANEAITEAEEEEAQ